MTWTLGEDLQEISVPYLIIEGNQSLTVRHSKVACCQPKPQKLTIYHWIRGELRLATLFKLKDCWTLMDQTRKHKVRQKNTDRQKKKKIRWPTQYFRARNTTQAPQASLIDTTAFPIRLEIVTNQAWWQLLLEQNTLKNNFCIRNDSGDCQLSRNHSKILLESLS